LLKSKVVMKKYFPAFCIIAIFVSCSTIGPPKVENGTYINPEFEFSVKMPDGWMNSKPIPPWVLEQIPPLEKINLKFMFTNTAPQLGIMSKGRILASCGKLEISWEKLLLSWDKEITILTKKLEKNKNQIEQVLVNFYVNAWHAMPKGGHLYIETENVRLNDDFCNPFKVPGGKYVKISVTDTGVGMDQKIMRRIFEPFFTTKQAGKGTGLGLALAYSIITNHRGIIKASSKKGHGSTFNIYLPAS